MNKKQFEIYKIWRAKKYTRDLEKVRSEMAARGLGSSSIRNQEEDWLKDEFGADLEQKKFESIEYEEKKGDNRKTSKIQRTTNIFLVLVSVGSLGVSLWVARDTNSRSEILNRPYIAVDSSGMSTQLNVGKVKSDLNNFSEQLIEKHFEFSIKNLGQSPAAFSIDLSEFKEVGLKNIIPQENSSGVIFPGESKNVSYLLEIHSSFPPSDEEKGGGEEYLKRMKAVEDNRQKYMSRITITYDYLGNKKGAAFHTFIDEKFPKTYFSENAAARIDAFSSVWITSPDSN